MSKWEPGVDAANRRIRIAFLIDTIATATAGTQKQLLEVIRRLDRNKFEPYLLCLWQSPWMTSNVLPCPTVTLGYRGLLKPSLPSVLRNLASFIDRHHVDILQTFFEDSIFVAWLSAAFAHSPPLLLSSRRDINLGRGNQPWYHVLYGLALPWVNRRFTGIVANSEQVRCYVMRRERTPAAKIKVIYNGVTLPNADNLTRPEIFRAHSAGVWLVIAANLTPVKRHDLLFRTMSSLVAVDSHPTVRLLCLGEGPERSRLERLAEALGIRERVNFMGAVDDVDAYLFHADIGVLCSDREGLSNAILEYMACGLPVVATAVGGNGELVDDRNGSCIPPGNTAELGHALRRLVHDPQLRKRQGSASLAKARDLFSWSRSLRELESYYLTLLGRD